MPLFRIQKPDRQTGIAIWQMTESLESLPRPTQIDYGKYGSPHRLQEILTEYLLLQKLTGQQGLVINHRPNGAPLVNGYHVSITHTKGWAAMMLSEDHSVGIDIEYISDRVDRITSRFLRPDEQQSTLGECLVNWCAKEAVYKYYSDLDLRFNEMRALPYCQSSSGVLVMENLRQHETVSVSYEMNQYFVLAYLR